MAARVAGLMVVADGMEAVWAAAVEAWKAGLVVACLADPPAGRKAIAMAAMAVAAAAREAVEAAAVREGMAATAVGAEMAATAVARATG